MNWKSIGRLSLFGLVMSIATVYVIPSDIEAMCWFSVVTDL